MGALKVVVVQDGQETQIFSKSGNQGNQWLEFTYDLAPFLGGNVHVKFVGTTGPSFSGDMAIDDLYFTGTKLVTNTQKISPDMAQLFPNPASGSVTIKTNNGSLVQQVNISNSNGVLVKQINFPSSPIDVTDLANGFYFVQVKMGEKSVTLKLIKH